MPEPAQIPSRMEHVDRDAARLLVSTPDWRVLVLRLEDKLYKGRAHSVGHKGQRANLLGYALLVNSVTLYVARRRGGVRGTPPPASTGGA